ncbi:hypothetical protein U9M48_000722 [Paspalum notatum var. saurae]|uniref:non-specific serine/threonine protein kinase n=1 Tax=Paspalum notatum var. saurae TaxID=547442 RepID=A0AAQ3PH76_PASNO
MKHHDRPPRSWGLVACTSLFMMGNCAGVEGNINAEINPPSFSAPSSSGTDSKNISNNASDTSTFGTKTSVSSSSVPPTPRRETKILASSNVRKFTFNELKGATRNFRPDGLLGEGGFGPMFKGWMDERTLVPTKPGAGMIVAVKKLNLESLQGHREWLAEVNYLGQLSHPNIVKLIGYCLEDEQRLLVYEYMPRGSLDHHLFRKVSHFQPLPWNLRMKVTLEAARGLAFLHGANVIHRGFKTSDILLDSEYNAKLSDFGLAKDGPSGDESHVSTRVMGTLGFAAPEYVATGHLTRKCDVYSYGVVLLELLSGLRALDRNRPPDQRNLVQWSRPYITNKRRVIRVLDSRLGSQYSLSEAQKIAGLAQQCLSTDPRCRPGMDQVVTVLEGIQKANDAVRAGK